MIDFAEFASVKLKQEKFDSLVKTHPQLKIFLNLYKMLPYLSVASIFALNKEFIKSGLSSHIEESNYIHWNITSNLSYAGNDTIGNGVHMNSAVSMVKKMASGAKLFIPVNANFSFLTYGDYASSDYAITPPNTNLDEYNIKFLKWIDKTFSKDFWDIDKAVTYKVDAKFNELWNLKTTKGDFEKTNKVIKPLMNFIKGLYVISPAARPVQHNRKIRSLSAFNKEKYPNEESKARDLATFRRAIVAARNPMHLYMELEVSQEFLQKVTNSKNPRTEHIHQWCMSTVRYVTSGVVKDKRKEIIKDLDNIPMFVPLQKVRLINKNLSDKKPRINKQGLCIDPHGYPLYVPSMDNIDSFDEKYKDVATEDPTFGFGLDSPFKPIHEADKWAANVVGRQILFYDEKHAKLTSTTDLSDINVVDIEKMLPLKIQHVQSLMSSRLDSQIIKNGLVRCDSIMESLNLDPRSFIESQDLTEAYSQDGSIIIRAEKDDVTATVARNINLGNYISYLSTVFSNIRNYTRRQKLDFKSNPKPEHEWFYESNTDRLMDYLTFENLAVENTPFKLMRPYNRMVYAACKYVLENKEKFLRERGLKSSMEFIAFAHLVVHYLPKHERVESETREYTDKIQKVKPRQDWKPKAVPGIRQGFSLLPQQGNALQQIEKAPDFGILAIDPGGGKTITAIMHSMNMIMDRKIRRSLIVCPGNLVHQYGEDLLEVTGGQWNFFPLTRETASYTSSWDRIESMMERVKQAPPNTIFVASYPFVAGQKYTFGYGTSQVVNWANTELLEEVGFDMIICDESHFLKSEDTDRVNAIRKFVTGIPYRYLMSGTTIDKDPTDLYMQISLLDPTILGSYDDFANKYIAKTEAGHVTLWNTNAARDMYQEIDRRISHVVIRKKEWEALLPKKIENFHEATLTEMQQKIYDKMKNNILEEIHNDPGVLDLLKRVQKAEKSMDADKIEDVDFSALLKEINFEKNPKLKTYIQRMEKMMTAPRAESAAVGIPLERKDWVSPKVGIAVDLCRKHIKENIPGKIFILVNYYVSRDEVYAHLPEDLKDRTIVYDTSKKAKHINEFRKNPRYQIMLGVQDSLKQGLNMEFVSRMIRLESVWNPGDLIQSEARIMRPDVGNKYNIKEKYIDWVVCTKTIDVTKVARLMARIMTKVNFEEKDNPFYKNLPKLPLIQMSLESIRAQNDFDYLSEYLNGYKEYQEATYKDYAAYRQSADILKDPFVVPREKKPGEHVIIDTPYLEGQSIPYEEKFGIKNLLSYASENDLDILDIELEGRAVHTEFGDGVVISPDASTRKDTDRVKRTVKVRLRNGKRVNGVPKASLSIFLNNKLPKTPVKEQLASLLSSRYVAEDLSAHVNTKATQRMIDEKSVDKPKKPIPNTDTEAGNGFNLYALTINGQVVVGVDELDPDVTDDMLKSEGFKYTGNYAYTHIPDRTAMRGLRNFLVKEVKAGRITLQQKMREDFMYVANAWETFGETKAKIVQKLDTSDMRLFYRIRVNVAQDKKRVNIFMAIEDDEVYAIIDLEKAVTGGRKFIARAKNIPGIDWDVDNSNWMKFFVKKPEALIFARSLTKKYNVKNWDDFVEELDSLKIRKIETSSKVLGEDE